MSQQINIEELKALIANGIRQENLDGSLPEDAIEKIKDKILAFKKREAAKEIPSIVSELDTPVLPAGGNVGGVFPDQSQIGVSTEQQINSTGSTEDFSVVPGSSPTEQPSIPIIGYTPELPELLKKAEPSELFVFQYNDIGESGENLSYKAMRLMDDPDVKKSMNDLWIEQGKTKAKIYAAKFEEIGEITFNYANGTSSFVEKSSEPDYAGGSGYKENPYITSSMPQIDASTKGELETYIKNSVDLEKVVHDIVMGIVKDSLLTNTEKAVNATGEEQEISMVNTMGESIDHGDEEVEFKITMSEIVESVDFQKVMLPKELNKKINSGDKTMLVKENSEVQKWKWGNETYYIPVDRISKSRGYIKS